MFAVLNLCFSICRL